MRCGRCTVATGVPVKLWVSRMTSSVASRAASITRPISQPSPSGASALPETEAPGFVADTRLFAHDLVTGAKQVRDFGAGRYPGEFVFVPRSADAAEGDGWLMGLVIDAAREATELVILDTHDFTGTPVATVHLPHRIPPGFHGNWIAA